MIAFNPLVKMLFPHHASPTKHNQAQDAENHFSKTIKSPFSAAKQQRYEVPNGPSPLRKPTKVWSILFTLVVTIVMLSWTTRSYLAPILLPQIKTKSSSTTSSVFGRVLDVFQVYPPVQQRLRYSTNDNDSQSENETQNDARKDCPDTGHDIILMKHSFGFSYGKPFVGEYKPPKCNFNRVTMNLTVTSRGRQFDRLAIMYLNDTEVYRTSTAEPTFDGIRWEYVKDMSPYMSLWNSPQKVIFDLGNLVNDLYTAAFNTTLIATFSSVEGSLDPADLILPLSAKQGSLNKPSVYMLPNDNAINTMDIPRNIKRAVFSISACGQAAEEFWWANSPQSKIDTFKETVGVLYGYSPFREVQLLIDGQLAGVQWPFPVIFTGGVVPGLWRPIVGIQTFDLREHEIDITPWLPLLCDGQSHTFEIRVVGIDDNVQPAALTKVVGDSWYVTGKLWLWLDDDPQAVTIGGPRTSYLLEPAVAIVSDTTKDSSGTNMTLEYRVTVERSLSISSSVTTQEGNHLSNWTQNLILRSNNVFTEYGKDQETHHYVSGSDFSTGMNPYAAQYQYILSADTNFSTEESGNFTLDATLAQAFFLSTEGASLFEPALSTALSTTLNGSAHYFASPKARLSTGFGSTTQLLAYVSGPQDSQHPPENERLNKYSSGNDSSKEEGFRYFRFVDAINGTVVTDHERINNVDVSRPTPLRSVPNPSGAAWGSVMHPKEAIGRGSGATGSSVLGRGTTADFGEDVLGDEAR